MQALATQLEEARSQRLLMQDQVVKIHNRINEVIVKQKRIEAEIEEIDLLPDSQAVYRQISRMFMSYNVKELRKKLKIELEETEQELPKLKEIETNLQERLTVAQKSYFEVEHAFVAEMQKSATQPIVK